MRVLKRVGVQALRRDFLFLSAYAMKKVSTIEGKYYEKTKTQLPHATFIQHINFGTGMVVAATRMTTSEYM